MPATAFRFRPFLPTILVGASLGTPLAEADAQGLTELPTIEVQDSERQGVVGYVATDSAAGTKGSPHDLFETAR